jgi:hypothetical protein
MQLSRDNLTNRLQTTSPYDLAVEIADDQAANYRGPGHIDHAATVARYVKMLTPLVPQTIKATELARTMGIVVVEN